MESSNASTFGAYHVKITALSQKLGSIGIFEFVIFMVCNKLQKNQEVRKIQGPFGEVSFSVGLPIKFLRVMEIGKGDYVKISIEGGEKIVITKI